MALPEKRDELYRVDDSIVREDHRAIENNRERSDERNRTDHARHGHEFAMDVHPEQYPRESLSRLEEGIFDDDEIRREHDRLGYVGPDMESRIDDSRSLSRTLVVLGSCLLGFAWVLLLWVGWDVRGGDVFFTTMCAIAAVTGLGLIVWGYIERQRVMRLRTHHAMPSGERRERIDRERKLRTGDRAA